MPRIAVEENNPMHLDHVKLSERDGLRILDLLEHPPAPNAKLLAAARALPKRS